MSSIEEIGPILDEYETNVYIYQNETIELQNESSDVISPCEKYLDLMDYNLSIGKNLSICKRIASMFIWILTLLFFTEFDTYKYLELCMASRRPWAEVYLIPLTIIHCIMFFTGIIGNVLGKKRKL